ncbi:MAG: protein kinase, partial [Myxococcales bacterium]|nr:protein kinase [Myxococcales bacterium]
MNDAGEHTWEVAAESTLPMSGVSSLADVEGARALEPGERVGRYVVRRPIGAGGMGTVYLAHDPDLDRLVALKILHSGGDRAARERLLREAQATARLAHPNVVSVYDVGSFEEGSFVALEYVQGGTLRGWLRQEGRTWSQILRALLHAGRGLAAAHSAGLVHRDFKPDNVLIGADGRVRVADFGLARQLEVTSEAVEVGELLDPEGGTIQAGHLAGTPGYMAPEQLRGVEVDARTDVFAFGVTLWEALAGERPYGGVTFIEHASHVLQGRTRPFPRDTAVPITVIQAIQRAISVDPAGRWQSLDELVAVLGASIDNAGASLTSAVRPFEEGEERPMPAALGVRYQLLEPFAGGTFGSIFRARDRLEGLLVAVKRTHPLRLPKTTEGGPSPRVMVARELRRRLALRHPNLVGIVDFGFDDEDIAFFVLDLPEAAQPLLSAARDAPRAIQIHLVGQLLRALIYLHQRGRVGVRLDAQTVVVVGDVLKVIDTDWFDDADVSARASLSAAPEIAAGGSTTVASDLFAVGVLIASLVDGGERPTDESWHAALLSASQSGAVGRTLRIEGPLGEFLGRLLATNPAARPRSAAAALAMLAAATGVDLPAETVHTRESFLQAGALVGREAELDLLTEALRGCLRGRSRVLAVAGESGVGKSRLVDEVRALGLVFGAVVLRGYASREGGRLFEAWRPLLRWLVISTPLSDLEASVLRIGVPDIDLLLGRAVPSAPPLDAASAQLRLLQVILAILRRQVRTMVVLIEDLHWARRESLDLLAAIARELDGLRLLVVVTYRDDETPHLLSDLPEVERIRVGRLDRAGIAAVAEAMLGEGARRPELVELLARETEGNALFVVEVMRSLAEEAGTLAAIGDRPLPPTIAAGGIQRVIQRRIGRLSPPTRRFLGLAAVIGRDLDPELMATVAADLDIDAHIAEAAEAAALEREGAGWRFAHEKIRESLLEQLSEERRIEIHGMVAEALEASSADDRDRAEALALHFRAIGRHDRELVYVARAGERVVSTSPEVGAELLQRAVNLGRVQGTGALDLARW